MESEDRRANREKMVQWAHRVPKGSRAQRARKAHKVSKAPRANKDQKVILVLQALMARTMC